MIRINLLPVSEAQRQKSGRQFLILCALLIIGEIFCLFLVQSAEEEELRLVNNQNTAISKKIKKLKKKTSTVTSLKAEQQELEQQKAVLDSLIEGQSGPVKMLDELSRILTPITDPKAKLQVQSLGWNPDWDPKRLWIDGFVESSRAVKIIGHARNNEDLAEFLERLNSSRHFVKVQLNVSNAVEIRELNDARLVRFDISAYVIYGPADLKRLAAGSLGQSVKRK